MDFQILNKNGWSKVSKNDKNELLKLGVQKWYFTPNYYILHTPNYFLDAFSDST